MSKAGDTGSPGCAVRRMREHMARIAILGEADRLRVLRGLSVAELRSLHDCWAIRAHDGQLPPDGDWNLWLIQAGRGFGKTRAGAEWVSALARDRPDARIALVGATAEDVARVMVEGQSGLIAVAHHGERFQWHRNRGEFAFASGARAYVFSAEAPDKLRGPEHDAAWCDELAKWRYGEAAWDNLLLGMRLSVRPRVLVTTTPRANPLMRRLIVAHGGVRTTGRTGDNAHLPDSYVAHVTQVYAGSRLGRQELDGELIDEVEGALWTRTMLDAQRATATPALLRVVVGVDPPAGTLSGGGGDACGIVAVGLGVDGCGYVLEDASVAGRSPEGWARAVADCAARVGADRVVAEANQGGTMVRSVLTAADAAMPLTLVHAARGKVARAEPVAALYECRKVWHAGMFRELEDELCGLSTGGTYDGPGRSPDRADACVWALTALMLGVRREAAVRVI